MKKALYLLRNDCLDLIYGPAEREAIAKLVDVRSRPMTAEDVQADPSPLADVEVILSGWGMPRVDESFLAAAPKLEAIFYGAGSIRGFATPALWRRGIMVTSAYGENAVPVAEYTLASILFCLKHAFRFARECRTARRFVEKRHAEIAGAYDAVVGLISLGKVGRLVRERLRPFGLQILAYDPFLSPADAVELDVTPAKLDAIFARSDVVSLHTPILPATRGMVTGAHIAAMKPHAAFVNTARGAVVREAEMLDVLRRRPDIQAVLDVTDPEPPVSESALFDLPNVFLTPHIAGSVGTECRRMGAAMAQDLALYLKGLPPAGRITEAMAAVLA